LVGLGCEQTDHDKILADIAASGKPVSYIGIQECGGPQNAVAKGIAMVENYQAQAAGLPRKEFPLSKLVLAVQCGGSDWTTALSGNITIGEMTDLVVAEGGSVIIGTAHIPSRSARTTVCQKALKLRLVKKASPPITSPKASIATLIFHAPRNSPKQQQSKNSTPANANAQRLFESSIPHTSIHSDEKKATSG
jgi:hypothetical protein